MILIKFNFHVIRSVAFIKDVTTAGSWFQNGRIKRNITERFSIKFILNNNVGGKQLSRQNKV